MTKEDAVSILYALRADNLNFDDLYTRDKYEALDIAIEALTKEPEPVYFPPCKDCNTKMNEIRRAFARVKAQERAEEIMTSEDAKEILLKFDADMSLAEGLKEIMSVDNVRDVRLALNRAVEALSRE